MSESYILAIDQGTTSSRALVFNEQMQVCGQAQQEFTQYFPQDGWVEHDPDEIWTSVVKTCRKAIAQARIEASDVAALGITNQRETLVAWHRETLQPLGPAIVWQDRRTANYCQKLKKQGLEPLIQEKTGLLLDPYFSASKMRWMLDNVAEVKQACDKKQLCFGTIDCFLIAQFSGAHVTDVTNASRTQLFNIHSLEWDEELLGIFDIPRHTLAEVKACDDFFANVNEEILGATMPICGVAGDQQAALIGQACFNKGQIKSTYGTGCFALLNTGEEMIQSQHRLLTTIAYQMDGQVHYALEGSIFIAGATVQWLRDGLQIIKQGGDSEFFAKQQTEEQSVWLVPAFTGLGAPHWNADVRGAIFGITRSTGIKEICYAALTSVAFQTADLFDAMYEDLGQTQVDMKVASCVRVDGGMSNNQWLMQFLADLLDVPIEQPVHAETTVQGAAYLAGKHIGLYSGTQEFSEQWLCHQEYLPQKKNEWRQAQKRAWRKAVDSAIKFSE